MLSSAYIQSQWDSAVRHGHGQTAQRLSLDTRLWLIVIARDMGNLSHIH